MKVVVSSRQELDALQKHLEGECGFYDDAVEAPTMNYFLILYPDSEIINRESMSNFTDYSSYEVTLEEVSKEYNYEANNI